MVLAGLFLCAGVPAGASPYQLIEAPSARLIEDGGQELKFDYDLDTGPIPANSYIFGYRYGLFRWMEVSGQAVYSQFPDQKIERLSEVAVAAKFGLPLPYKTRFYLLLAYRRALGDPILVNYTGGFSEVTSVVSPRADAGKDTSLGILVRFPDGKYPWSMGGVYTRAGGRNYADFNDGQRNVYTLYLSPEGHFFSDTLMIAVENRYTNWVNRGDFLNTIPQVRWEFSKDWIVEAGVSIPIIGGNAYRYLLGITFEF